jgi:hypothetical protein
MPNDRIRVLHPAWRLTSMGGVPAIFRAVVSRLEPDRLEAHVLSVRPRLPQDDLDAPGPHVEFHSLEYRGQHTRAARLGLSLSTARFVRRIRPDVLHTHSGSAWMSVPSALTCPGARRLGSGRIGAPTGHCSLNWHPWALSRGCPRYSSGRVSIHVACVTRRTGPVGTTPPWLGGRRCRSGD